ncbi:MAG: DUF6551 family protein [Rhodospirillaceae bacterium]
MTNIATLDRDAALGAVTMATIPAMNGETPGTLAWLQKHRLLVDSAYQRRMRPGKVERIRSGWDWRACGALSVEERGGKYYVTDGQHRLGAAMEIDSIFTLPCVIFKSAGVGREAASFLKLNTERKPLGAVEKHRARVESGDSAALLLQRLADGINRRLTGSSSPNEIACVQTLYVLACRKPAELEATWPFLARLFSGGVFEQRLVSGVMYLAERGVDFTDEATARRFLNIGADRFSSAIKSWINAHGRSGAAMYAHAMLNLYNRGLRSRKLNV